MSSSHTAQSASKIAWPSSRLEAWKYTDLHQLAAKLSRNESPLSPSGWQGQPHELLDLFTELHNAEPIFQPFDELYGLIQAARHGGWHAHIPAGIACNAPLRLSYAPSVTAGWSGFTHQFQVDEGAQLTLIEEFDEGRPEGNNSGRSNPQPSDTPPVERMNLHHLQVHLGRGAELKLIRLFHGPAATALVHQIDAVQEEGSKLEVQTISLGSGMIRNNIHIQQKGDRCSSTLLGLSVAFGGGHLDQYSRIQHLALEGNSHQHYKAIAAPNSTTVFNGVLRVEPHAQQTNAYQRSSNLMLDPASLGQGHPLKPTLRSGKVNAKPELQIFADNVKCSHGATMGKLNTESIFYLQSRGLSFEEAQRMLTLAFAMEIVDQLEDEVIRNKVMAHLDQLEWQ